MHVTEEEAESSKCILRQLRAFKHFDPRQQFFCMYPQKISPTIPTLLYLTAGSFSHRARGWQGAAGTPNYAHIQKAPNMIVIYVASTLQPYSVSLVVALPARTSIYALAGSSSPKWGKLFAKPPPPPQIRFASHLFTLCLPTPAQFRMLEFVSSFWLGGRDFLPEISRQQTHAWASCTHGGPAGQSRV